MSQIEAKKITKKYIKKLKKEDFPFSAVYLFGSYAKNKAHKDSDIDIAVFSDKFKKITDKNISILWKLRRDVDLRIEPHGFYSKDIDCAWDPMVHEIKKTGIKISV